MSDLIFAKIQATDDDEQVVYGVASTDTPDAQGGEWDGQRYEGDIVEPAALIEALPDYLAWANIREMHQPSAVGRALSAEVKDGKLLLAAKVIAADAWQKVKERVYNGFSIGGKVIAAKLVKIDGKVYRLITQLKLFEISLVDRPANPDARILVWKLEGDPPQQSTGGNNVGEFEEKQPDETAPEQPEAAADSGDKTANDDSGVIKQLQKKRDLCELNGDMAGATRYNLAIAALIIGEAEMDEEGEMEMAEGDVTMAQPAGDAQKALTEADIAKAIEPKLDALNATLAALNERLARLEAQPAAGGPALRAVDKAITPLPEKPAGQGISKGQLDELKRLANTEPNPALRMSYQQQYTAALEQLTK